jgi:hypothetical protein
MSITSTQHARIEKLTKSGLSFPAISDKMGIALHTLYRAYPGGARIIRGEAPYAARTKPAAPRAKKPAKKKAKKRRIKEDW